MADAPDTPAPSRNGPSDRTPAATPDIEARSHHRQYAQNLSPEEHLLLTLRVQLYHNSWDAMIADLRDRLKGRPYIFKLVNRIEEDLNRIDKLQSYELKHKIDLYDFLEGDEA